MYLGTLPDMEAALERAEVGSRVVVHDDPALIFVVAEYVLQRGEHLVVSWLSVGRHV